MSAKHTPGPWTQGTSKAGVMCVWLNGLTEPEDEMGPDHTWIDCNTEANARLIAAAPDLLKALEFFLKWGRCQKAEDMAREAIAKAIG